MPTKLPGVDTYIVIHVAGEYSVASEVTNLHASAIVDAVEKGEGMVNVQVRGSAAWVYLPARSVVAVSMAKIEA